MFISYNHLKDDFKSNCSMCLNNTNFFELKKFYESYINSVRRLSYCDTLDDLIKLLEKADILNENDVTAFKQIVQIIGDYNLQKVIDYIELYEKQKTKEKEILSQQMNKRDANLHFNKLNSIQYSVTSNAPISSIWSTQSQPNTQIDEDKVKNICYKIICDNLGQKWKYVGRALAIPEGVMDDISRTHKNDMPSQILEMLQRWEENPLYERRTLRTELTSALRKGRRVDLANQIANIFDLHS